MKKKSLIKHPLYISLLLPLVIVLGVASIMMNLDRIYKLPNYVNAVVGVSLGVFSIVWLFLFFKNFSKMMKIEEKSKLNKVKKYAFLNKNFILIQRRSILANLALIIGGLSIFVAWLTLFPIAPFNSIGYWIFRIVSIVITILGAIFSFVTPKKMLIYKNGELIINNENESLIIKPDELIDYKKIYSYPKDKNKNRQSLYIDIVLILNDKEIVLKKADCDIFLKEILKLIRQIDRINEN